MSNEGLKPDVHEWLTGQCNRLMYRQCLTHRCMIRGGYKDPGPIGFTQATCEAYELSNAIARTPTDTAALSRLREALEGLRCSRHGCWCPRELETSEHTVECQRARAALHDAGSEG